jgi:hypothetical protein
MMGTWDIPPPDFFSKMLGVYKNSTKVFLGDLKWAHAPLVPLDPRYGSLHFKLIFN